jgi:hypothetical protein
MKLFRIHSFFAFSAIFQDKLVVVFAQEWRMEQPVRIRIDE